MLSLQELDLRNNNFSVFPEQILSLINLQEIKFADNQLTEIPSEIVQLTKLKYLDLYNNTINNPDNLKQLLPKVEVDF